ncbi:MAG: hypothetical protein V4482_01440 [Pseudomonadota bacterium]
MGLVKLCRLLPIPIFVVLFVFLTLSKAYSSAPVQIIVAAGDQTVHAQQQDNPLNPGVPIVKTGLGDLLSITSIYTGTTTISEGRWFAMGSLGTATGTAITIANGATLGGSGVITGAIHNSGTLSPSAGGVSVDGVPVPVGTQMNVTGSLTQTANGVIHLHITPSTHDKMIVSGTADLSYGEILITTLPGYYPPSTTYTVLTVTSLIGRPVPINTSTNLIMNYVYVGPELQLTFTGVNYAVANTTVDVSVLSDVTGAINVENLGVITSTEGTSGAVLITNIPNKIVFTGISSIMPASYSTIEFSGEVDGVSTSQLNLIGSGANKAVEFGSNMTNFHGTINATDVNLIINGATGASINVENGGIFGGSGAVGVVNAMDGAILKPGSPAVNANYARLTTVGSAHYQLEMNNGQSNTIDVSGRINLGSNFTVDVLMDQDTYTITAGTSYPILTAGALLTGNVRTLTWTAQSGLVFDIELSPDGKTISLLSTCASPITISANQTAVGLTTRGIVHAGLTESLSDLASYNYVSLIGGTISNATGTQTISVPISVVGSSTINTASGYETQIAAELIGNSNATLTLSGGGTTTISVSNPDFSSAVNVNSSTVNLAAGADIGTGPLTLNNSTLVLEDASGFSNLLTISGTSNLIANAEAITFDQIITQTLDSTLNISGTSPTITFVNSITLPRSALNLSGTGQTIVNAPIVGGANSSMNLTAGRTVIFTVANPDFNGTISLNNSILSVDNAANAGSGQITLSNGSELKLGNATLLNAIAMADTSTFAVISEASAVFSGPLSGEGLAISTISGSNGNVKIQGYSPNYTGAVNASNINLFVNGTIGSSLTAGTGSVLSGTGFVGDVTLEDGAIIAPGDYDSDLIGTIKVKSLTVNGNSSEMHYQVQLNPLGQISQITVVGNGTATLSTNITVDIITVDILTAPGNYPVGTSNYTILATNELISGNIAALTWAPQTDLAFNVGLSEDRKSIVLQSIITGTAGATLALAGNTVPGGNSIMIDSNSVISPLSPIVYNNSTAVSGDIAMFTPNTPVNLNGAIIANTSGAPHTLTAAINLVDTSEISTYSNSETIIATAISSAIGTTLNLTGGGVTTFLSDNGATLQGGVAVHGSTVNVEQKSNLGSGALTLTNGAQVNLADGASLNNAVTTDAGTTITLQPVNNSIVVNGSLAGQGAVSITNGGTAIFNSVNTRLSGPIQLSSSTAHVSDGSNLGTGALSLEKSDGGADPTIVMGAVTLRNPISAGAAATFTSNSAATLSGAITGTEALTFNGSGSTNLTGTGVSPYTGTLTVNSGKLSVNSNMPNTSVSVGADAILGGNGTMRDVVLSGKIKPGNSIGTQYHDSFTTVSGASYDVEINAAGESNRIVVENDALLNGIFSLNVLMDNGNYPAGTIDFNILTVGGSLTVDQLDVKWNAQSIDGLTFTAGVLNEPGGEYDGQALVLKYNATRPFTIAVGGAAGQTSVDTTTRDTTYDEVDLTDPADITIGANDIIAADSGLALPSVPVVLDLPEITDLVFNDGGSGGDISTAATIDTFHFNKATSAMGRPSNKKDVIESLITALSKNGPVSYEKNDTRVWIAPYVNRSRSARTESTLGNQGWSGGSLIGVEHKNNKGSTGLLTGLMGSRSHTLGDPNTFSKTKGMLVGLSNKHNYTENWHHELLIAQVNTFVDAQRYGLDSTHKNAPFYALASYKSITNIGNAQLNYIFDLIKAGATCRLNTGLSYQGTKTGKITEYNAGTNGISLSESSAESIQFYNGIGFRKDWKVDNAAIRSTFVYEYGYAAFQKGSPMKGITQSLSPTTFSSPPGPRQNKHYIQFSTSYKEHDSNLKFSLSYSGTLYKNVKSHTVMFKIDRKF